MSLQSNLSKGNIEIGLQKNRRLLNTGLFNMKCIVKGNENYGHIMQAIV